MRTDLSICVDSELTGGVRQASLPLLWTAGQAFPHRASPQTLLSSYGNSDAAALSAPRFQRLTRPVFVGAHDRDHLLVLSAEASPRKVHPTRTVVLPGPPAVKPLCELQSGSPAALRLPTDCERLNMPGGRVFFPPTKRDPTSVEAWRCYPCPSHHGLGKASA